MGTGFYGSNDPTNSMKALKEPLWKRTIVTENTNDSVVYKTLSHWAWSESRVSDAGSVSDIEKSIPTAGTTSATKPEVEI